MSEYVGAVRCLKCGKIYKQPPGDWNCVECGGMVSMHMGTIHVESAQQREPNDDERVEYERLVKALRNAREAIARLDEDALGRDQREGWSYRDELLAEIDAALGGQQNGAAAE